MNPWASNPEEIHAASNWESARRLIDNEFSDHRSPITDHAINASIPPSPKGPASHRTPLFLLLAVALFALLLVAPAITIVRADLTLRDQLQSTH